MNRTKAGPSLRSKLTVALMWSALIVLTIGGCKEIQINISKKPQKPSASELLATKAVEKSFRCRLTSSKGTEQLDSSSKEEERYFRLVLHGIDTLAFDGDWKTPATTCAFLFYAALNDSDRSRFDGIRVAFRHETEFSSSEREFAFRANTFRNDVQCRQQLDTLLNCLRDGDAALLTTLCDTNEFTSKVVMQLWDLGRHIDSICGPIQEFRTTGILSMTDATEFTGLLSGTMGSCRIMFNIESGKPRHFLRAVKYF